MAILSSPDLRQSRPVLCWSLALFGFLLASFPARNLDLWVHLAQGRDFLAGAFVPRPGLVYDLMIWAMAWSLGGTLVVLLKAVLIGMMARNLIAASPSQRPWLIALGVGLALLAMSNRLLVQPLVVSLVLTSWMMARFGRQVTPLPLAAIAVIGLVWSLLDPWFGIAGALAFLAALGAWVDARHQGRPSAEPFTWMIGLGLGWALWFGLAWQGPGGPGALLADWLGPDGWFRSPFRQEFVDQAWQIPGSLAFFPLFGLGALALLAGWRGLPWFLILPWVVAALAACLHLRFIPWLALFSGPLIASGLTMAFQKGETAANPLAHTTRWPRLGDGLGWVILGLFLVMAWPGWLQLPPYGPRDWRFDPHPSWKETGTRVQAFLAKGWNLGASPVPTVAVSSLSLARALSWFHPQIDWVFEPRLVQSESFDPKARLVLAFDPDKIRSQSVMRAFLGRSPAWQIAHLGGGVAIFSRTTEKENGLPPWDAESQAFALGPPGETQEDFADAPIPEDHEGQWWRAFFERKSGWKPGREQAELLLLLADWDRQRAPGKAMRAWVMSQAASLGPSAAGWIQGAPFDAFLRVQMLGPIRQGAFEPNSLRPVEAWSLQLQENHAQRFGLTSPAPLYLAIRELRRELSQGWPDALSRNLLAESYQRLAIHSTEVRWATKVPGIGQMRRVQAVRDMAEAVRLAPQQPDSRLALGQHFQELGYRDLALEQLDTQQTLLESLSPPSGPQGQAFTRELAQNRRRLDAMKEDLVRRLETWETNTKGLRVFDRAQAAMELGLAGKALSTLLQSDIAAFGLPGMQLEIQLLLFTGAAKQVRDWAETDPLDNQDEQSLRWTRIQAFAALGQYGSARKETELMSFPADSQESKDPPRELAALVLGQAVLEGFDAQPHLGGLVTQSFQRRRTEGRLDGLGRDLRLEAEGLALSGLLAVEEGRVALGRDYLRKALAVGTPAVSGWDFESRGMAIELLQRIEAANR